ncbi:MAG: universal stress protein [Sphingorhabdus sp.]|uniref:universal stress protein n=1 Tax=Sphingorhabdus sp. TaxID=1902408 RepID=UPI0025F54E11|nr:universal stress protein [Sphingorhabdus sp.]MCO4092921.1 universal stress protein [Sphingorhabdus sp.]
MKSVLLHINDDDGLEARMQVALDIVRATGGHLTCLHVTPIQTFVGADGFGAAYAAGELIAALERKEMLARGQIETQLAAEGVSWSILQETADPAVSLLNHSGLSDIIVLSSPRKAKGQGATFGVIGDVVIKSRTPVLAVPDSSRSFDINGTAVVAWNGSIESANAIRLAVPMLTLASEIHIVTVEEEKEDANYLPSTAASEYLSRHGLTSTLHAIPLQSASGSSAEVLVGKTVKLGADYLVMGAYGHSRIAQYFFGGVTRFMLRDAPFPLLIAH